MRHCLLVCALVALVLSGCGGGREEGNSTPAASSSVERAFAEDVGIAVSDARCVDDGSWNLEGTALSWCSSIATPGLYDGCYATADGRDLTIAVRGSEEAGVHRCTGDAEDQIRANNPPGLRDEFDIERALERALDLDPEQDSATCGQRGPKRYGCSVLTGPNETDRGFVVVCGQPLTGSKPVASGCRYRGMTVEEEAAFGIDNPKANAYRAKLEGEAAAEPVEPTPKGLSGEQIAARLRAAGHANILLEHNQGGFFAISFEERGYRFSINQFASAAVAKDSASTLKAFNHATKAVGPITFDALKLGGPLAPAPKALFDQFVAEALGSTR